MISDGEVEFLDRRYGKNSVRLLHVKREGSWHKVKEVEANTKLTLNDARDFLRGDNAQVVATDSQKNTVYILAKKHGIKTIEEFGQQVTGHFLRQYPFVTDARIYIEEKPWNRIQQGGKDHSHAFLENAGATKFCNIEQSRDGKPLVSAGIKDMKILKTTQSGFSNFVNDEYRTLPDSDDRIFCTVVFAEWKYHTLDGLDFDAAWTAVKKAVLDIFAGPADTGAFSISVQKTIYDIQKAALSKVPQMSEITITLPNVHAYEFDFTRFPAFGITKNNEVFTPSDKPAGNISATLGRKQKSSP